jgi:hypothetical protein
VICTLFIHGHRFTFKHLCLHSITKILRNGPKAHFPFSNLDRDFAVEAPQTPVGARSQTGVPLVGVGCAALADHLRATSWPPKFWPHLPEKYDGTSNPSEFLQVYVTAITAAGGNTTVMATYFHVALSGPARTWLMNLTPGSVYS